MRSDTAIAKLLTPEELELAEKRRELTQLETTLADAELELATLQAELRAFERHYLSTVGRRYAELDEWEAKIAAALAQRDPKNDDLRRRAERARETAEDFCRDLLLLPLLTFQINEIILPPRCSGEQPNCVNPK